MEEKNLYAVFYNDTNAENTQCADRHMHTHSQCMLATKKTQKQTIA